VPVTYGVLLLFHRTMKTKGRERERDEER